MIREAQSKEARLITISSPIATNGFEHPERTRRVKPDRGGIPLRDQLMSVQMFRMFADSRTN